jgi:catechol 2,3-dioxygenase-like lactoylglutathione lyase family enzyme
MKLEHLAFNVADPVAVAAWYGEPCGLRVVRHLPERAQTHFLADDGATLIEIYCNPPEDVPDYPSMDPLQFHLAIESADPSADARRPCSTAIFKVIERGNARSCGLSLSRRKRPIGHGGPIGRSGA